ncbi:cytochrome P450 2A10-like isoform X2 [Lithobates pipiens]
MEIFSTSTLLLIACLILLILSITHTRNHQNKGRLPPGPTPLPIIGNILQLNGKEVFKSLNKLSETYGPVYTIHMGMETVVVLCSYDAVKEALVDNADDFGARGHMPLLDRISSGGHGQSVDPTLCIAKAVSNVICSVVFGSRFEYEDKTFLHLLALLHEIFKGFSSVWGQMYNLFPKVVGKIPGPHHKLFKAVDGIQNFIAERVKMHKETLDSGSPRDFIDCFLLKMEQEKDMPQTEFHMEGIVNSTFDLFAAGTETVSTTLRYGLLILLKHADVEERIHKEIDHVIGQNRAPCIEDRSHMPYLDAVIHEIQRFIDLIPMGIPHKVTRDVHFRDFIIPKDTTVYPMLGSVLQDPKQFKYPKEFNPGHFLDENGKFRRNDGYMPFSSGKRICLGEGLARMELFLFFATILQNFTLRSPVEPQDLDLTPQMSGFGNIPHPYELCFIPR